MISTTDATRRPSSEVVAALSVDPDRGLSAAEVERRRERFGPNELDAEPPIPAWRRFLDQFRDPLVYLLLAAIVVSLVAWWVDGAGETPVEALVIAAIVLLRMLNSPFMSRLLPIGAPL